MLHTNEDLPAIIGQNVTVGHLSLLEGCVIQDGAMIGMGSIVLNRARVGRRTMLTAGSVVTEDGKIPPEVLATGAPAEAKKDLDGSSSKWIESRASTRRSGSITWAERNRLLRVARGTRAPDPLNEAQAQGPLRHVEHVGSGAAIIV